MKVRKSQQSEQTWEQQQDSLLIYQTSNQTTVTELNKKSAQKNDHHGTEFKVTKPDKAKG